MIGFSFSASVSIQTVLTCVTVVVHVLLTVCYKFVSKHNFMSTFIFVKHKHLTCVDIRLHIFIGIQGVIDIYNNNCRGYNFLRNES